MSPLPRSMQTFSDSLSAALDEHLRDMNGRSCGNLHRIVVAEVEEKLAEFALRKCGGNCSEAARMLGISRTTLMRKKNGGGHGEN